MFDYNMWISSNPGLYLGHEEVSDEEYDAVFRSGIPWTERIKDVVRKSVHRAFSHEPYNYTDEIVDFHNSIIESSLIFAEYDGVVMSAMNISLNHVPDNIIARQKRMISDIREVVPASYGVIYMYSDDEEPFNGFFRVIKFVKEDLHIGSDTFFDLNFPRARKL